MEVSETVRARRAIKWYDPEHQMPAETFRTQMEHAILAPQYLTFRTGDFYG